MKQRASGNKVWLHIGMPKTGTTTLQATLYANRKLLAEHGYFYPDFGTRQHYPLVRKLASDIGAPPGGFPAVGDCGPYDRFVDLLGHEGMGAHTSLISSENFFLRLAIMSGARDTRRTNTLHWLEKAVNRAAEYFAGCEVTVLVWLRRQDHWLMSYYKEAVKTSYYADDVIAFADQTIGTEFFRILQFWIAAFGRERVLCRSYDTLAATGTSSVDAFLAMACPDITAGALAKAGEKHNLSMSNEALWLKKRINLALKRGRADPGRIPVRRILQLLDGVTRGSSDPGAPLLTLAERKVLMQRYLPDNNRLVTELGYGELWPLVDTSDLDGPDPAGTVAEQPEELYLRCLDQMIDTWVLPDRNDTQRPVAGAVPHDSERGQSGT